MCLLLMLHNYKSSGRMSKNVRPELWNAAVIDNFAAVIVAWDKAVYPLLDANEFLYEIPYAADYRHKIDEYPASVFACTGEPSHRNSEGS